MSDHGQSFCRWVGGLVLALTAIGCRARTDGPEEARANQPPNPFPDCVHPEVVEDCAGDWCRIPAGCFVMGSPEDEWGRGMYTEEQMAVTLTRPFAIMQHEVTQGEWSAAGLGLPLTLEGSSVDCVAADCPVRFITWFEAAAYANLLSASHEPPLAACYELVNCNGQLGEGLACETARLSAPTVYDCVGYRLSTEAEWEYAARGGTRTAFYSGGIREQRETGTCFLEPNLEEVGWYCSNSGGTTQPVGKKKPNDWGLHDILGNVYEWTNDSSEAAFPPGPLTDPGGVMEQVSARVSKGGSASSPSYALRSASRLELSWDLGTLSGLRLVRTLPPDEAP